MFLLLKLPNFRQLYSLLVYFWQISEDTNSNHKLDKKYKIKSNVYLKLLSWRNLNMIQPLLYKFINCTILLCEIFDIKAFKCKMKQVYIDICNCVFYILSVYKQMYIKWGCRYVYSKIKLHYFIYFTTFICYTAVIQQKITSSFYFTPFCSCFVSILYFVKILYLNIINTVYISLY